jgi:hypothetical protein
MFSKAILHSVIHMVMESRHFFSGFARNAGNADHFAELTKSLTRTSADLEQVENARYIIPVKQSVDVTF